MIQRDAVNQLFAQYAWAQDAADFAVLREVFTEDAQFTVEGPGIDKIGPIRAGTSSRTSASRRRARTGRP